MDRESALEHVSRSSPDPVAERVGRLKSLFPEAFTEGRVDFDKLRACLGDLVDDRPERYSFSWAGKRDAIRLLQTSSRATLKPDRGESVEFDTTQNLFVEGDNLEALKCLRRSYSGQVKMIYIDPPYNTGNDFIYPDNFADPLDRYLKLTGQKDTEGNLLTSNPETSGRYHSAWLSMMYPRLFLARQLLRDDGVMLVSIDDIEHANLRLLMNEVFGEENILSELVWNLATGTEAGHFTRSHEYVLVYAKNKPGVPYFPALDDTPISHGALKRISRDNPASDITFPAGMEFEGENAVFAGDLGGSEKQTVVGGKMVFENGRLKDPVTLRAGWAMRNQILSWLQGKDTVDSKGQEVKRFYFNSQGILWYEKERLSRHPKTVLSGIAKTKDGTADIVALFGEPIVEFPKPVTLIRFLVALATTDNDIVMDFFAGSSTTAQAVLELNREDGGNRRFVMVQLPEPTPEDSIARQAGYDTIADIGKERIRRVIAKLKKENEGKLPAAAGRERETPEDLGFRVFKLSESNYRQWEALAADADPVQYAGQMQLQNDPLLPGWNAEDVIYEVALREGYALTCRIEEALAPASGGTDVGATHESPSGACVWQVTDDDKGQSFYICLDDKFDLGTARALNLTKDDLLVCRDIALDDTTAANLALQCRVKTI